MLAGLALFLLTVLWILWRRRSLLKPVFVLIVFALALLYFYLYRCCFARRRS